MSEYCVLAFDSAPSAVVVVESVEYVKPRRRPAAAAEVGAVPMSEVGGPYLGANKSSPIPLIMA